MSGSFRNILRIGDTYGQEPAENKILSIGLRPDGFVFAVLDLENFKYIALEDFEYAPAIYCEDYFQRLNRLAADYPVLNAPFENVHVSLFTSNLLLIPAELYREEDKENLCQFCMSLPEYHTIYSERLNNLNALGIYSFSLQLKNFLDNRFGNYRLRHQGAALIESTLAAKQLEKWQTNLVLHVKRAFFEIILLDNQKVILYQSFQYQIFDDILYYLFYVLKQFEWDAADQKMVLIGEIGMDCEAFQILSSLFQKVSFPERNDAYRYAESFDQIPGHYYYNLLNLVTCG